MYERLKEKVNNTKVESDDDSDSEEVTIKAIKSENPPRATDGTSAALQPPTIPPADWKTFRMTPGVKPKRTMDQFQYVGQCSETQRLNNLTLNEQGVYDPSCNITDYAHLKKRAGPPLL